MVQREEQVQFLEAVRHCVVPLAVKVVLRAVQAVQADQQELALAVTVVLAVLVAVTPLVVQAVVQAVTLETAVMVMQVTLAETRLPVLEAVEAVAVLSLRVLLVVAV
jgi:hypothetical protein